MSGPLTWRNVDAPNFAGSLEGLRTASLLLGNAVKSGQDVVGAYTQANSDAADRAILNRALGVQSAGDFQAGLASGSIVGPDASRASVETLRGLDSRVGTLLNRDVVRENLGQTTYDNARGRQGDALLDAASPDLAQARLLARQGNQAALNQLIASSPALKGLRPDQLNTLFTGVDNLSTNFQNRRASDAKFIADQFDFGRVLKDTADADTAAAAQKKILRNSGNADDAQRGVEALADELTPGAFTRLNNGLRGAGFGVYGPVGGTTGAGGNAVSSSGSSATGLMTGGAQLPDTIQTIGDMVDNKANLLKINPKGTATGMHQITADTWADFAPKALGQGWRSANIRDPKVQDQVGKAIWDSVKDNPEGIQNRWASVNASEAANLKGATWDQVRDTLSQKESSSRASDILAQATTRTSNNLGADTAGQLMAERAGQNQATSIFPELNKLQSDRRDAGQVAAALVGAEGSYKGSDRGALVEYINRIVQQGKGRISPAMAGEILARNPDSSDSFPTRVGSRIADVFRSNNSSPNLAGGVRIRDAGVQQMMTEYMSGAMSTQYEAQKSLEAANQLKQSAQQAYNAADAQYQAMLSASQSKPGLRIHLERYKQQRDAAEQALSRVTQSVVNDDTLIPRYERPVATTTGSW